MDDSRHEAGSFIGNTGGTIRLDFVYEGSNVQLVSHEPVDMLPPPPSPIPLHEGQTGFWYELRDRADKIFYQRATQNPIRFDEEIYSDDPKQPINRQPVEDPRGVFVLLVPNTPQGDVVVLFSSPLDPESSAQPAKEFARFIIST
jgi:hypothetical protein